MKVIECLFLLLLAVSVLGCSNEANKNDPTPVATSAATPVATATSAEPTAAIDPLQDKGIGPVKSVELGPVDEKMAAEGEEIFKSKCAACHKMDKRRVGPPLRGVTARRTPEWIMNFIVNPAEMLEKNALAKELLAEYSTPMADQNISEAEARAILEYLRTKEEPDEK
jgi:mono/diheme cytochrome c family protein